MARSPTVSDEFAKKFATEKDTPYLRWVREEGLEVIGAQYVANLRTVELKPWPRRGGARRASGRRRYAKLARNTAASISLRSGVPPPTSPSIVSRK